MRGFMCFWGLRRDHGMQWGSVYLSITAQASIYLQSNARCKCSSSSSSSSLSSSSSYSSSSSSFIYLQSIVVEPAWLLRPARPRLDFWARIHQRRSIGPPCQRRDVFWTKEGQLVPPVSDVTFFGPKEISWSPLSVTWRFLDQRRSVGPPCQWRDVFWT